MLSPPKAANTTLSLCSLFRVTRHPTLQLFELEAPRVLFYEQKGCPLVRLIAAASDTHKVTVSDAQTPSRLQFHDHYLLQSI